LWLGEHTLKHPTVLCRLTLLLSGWFFLSCLGKDCTVGRKGTLDTDPPGFALRKKLHRKSFLLA